MKVKVLVADDHELVRAGLSTILQQQSGIEVIGGACDGLEAVRLATELKPDVIIMDLSMPQMNGVEATRQITSAHPQIKVIALSIHYDAIMVSEVLRAGACGYLFKNSASDELATAVKVARRGETYLSSKVTQVVVSTYIKNPDGREASAYSVLSPKQRRVLQLLAEGKSNKEVGSALQISAKTVETHRAQIMDKLKIHTVAGLTKYAIREGLTSLDT